MENKPARPGRTRRERRTSRWVWFAEHVARLCITIGGIGTIIAVAAVGLFLIVVAVPLFQSGQVTSENRANLSWAKSPPIQLGTDEEQNMCWALFADGNIQVVHLADGEIIEQLEMFEGQKVTASSFAPGSGEAAFGFADGSVRLGKVGFSIRFIEKADVPKELADLEVNKSARWKKGVVVRTLANQFRYSELNLELQDPAKGPTRSPVVKLDQSKTTTGVVMAVLTADGKLRLNTVREQRNLLTDEVTLKLSGIELPYTEPPSKGTPSNVFLSAVGDQVYVFWKNGHLQRFDARDRSKPVLAEERNLLEDPTLHVTDIRTLIGKGTFLVGDSSGRIRSWFFTNTPEATTTDGGMVVNAHEFRGYGSAVTAIAVSDRTRTAAAAFADGKVRLMYITSEKQIVEMSTGTGGPASVLGLAPKDDGLVAGAGVGFWRWKLDAMHPEISPATLFSKVWYEGYAKPQHMWQSSGGTDSFEPKFGLMALIFGTLKATFYSLLFGVPLALLAAIYTSEFMHPRAKAVVKPTIELMASLPSVVLGFLAGLVFAQFVEGVVPAVLACIVTVPLAFLGGAYVWQLMPEWLSLPLTRWRFAFILFVLPIGLLSAMVLGPYLEILFFDGNLRAWLDGAGGSSIGGWFFLLLPLSAVACALMMDRYGNPWLRQVTVSWSRSSAARLDLAKFFVALVFTIGLSWIGAQLLNLAGMEARGSIIGPYSQRNALVVGFVMGFAIIPIIYTLAEDALSSVPEHLRAGSLAAGATRWQTAMRIVIPTAMSGLFSAVMIGMGRAVGETMIVLMAAGNTPVMDLNIFNGFRTLSANIAVELPEAVANSTHYRTLFLAALTLFAMTFVLNTIAEAIRQRFRRRAYQL